MHRHSRIGKIAAAISLLGLLAVLFSGCHAVQLIERIGERVEAETQPQEYMSSDGQYSLTAPYSWSRVEDAGMPSATDFALQNRSGDSAVFFVQESKIYPLNQIDLETYQDLAIEMLEQTVDQFEIIDQYVMSTGRSMTEFSGLSDGEEYRYWMICTESEHDFIRVQGVCLATERDQREEEILQILGSLQGDSDVVEG